MPALSKAIMWHAGPMLDVWRQTLEGAVGVSEMHPAPRPVMAFVHRRAGVVRGRRVVVHLSLMPCRRTGARGPSRTRADAPRSEPPL